MPTSVQLLERAGPRSPSSFGFNMDGGRAAVPFRVDGPDIEAACRAIVGDVQPANDGSGRLKRTLPLSHPRFPQLYAERISNSQGVKWVADGPSPAGGVGNSLATVGEYGYQEVAVDFAPRNYSVLNDAFVTADHAVWTDVDGVSYDWKFADEWVRWVEWTVTDASELLGAEQGCLYFASDDTPISGAGRVSTDPMHGSAFPGKPKIPIKGDVLVADWKNVPWEYWASPKSYLRRFKWCVNLLPWQNYGPGELLYTGAKVVKRYQRPFPTLTELNGQIVVSQDFLCDLQLTFGVRQVPILGAPTNARGNLFNSPWNASPAFFDRKWRGIVMTAPSPNENDNTRWTAVYPSYLGAQILFTDPSTN